MWRMGLFSLSSQTVVIITMADIGQSLSWWSSGKTRRTALLFAAFSCCPLSQAHTADVCVNTGVWLVLDLIGCHSQAVYSGLVCVI